MHKKLRIAVLMGGASHEKEISLESGRNVCYKLEHEYEVVPLFVSSQMKLYELSDAHLVRNSTKEIEQLVNMEQPVAWSSLPSLVDFVFIALHGGAGENGSVQGMLEMLDLPYNGSGVLASALCMNKEKTTNFLAQHKFEVPQHCVVHKKEWLHNAQTIIENITQKLPFPLVVKPHDDGCSVFVSKVDNEHELRTAIDTLFVQEKTVALIEEFIKGMELTVGVIGNENPVALAPSQAITHKGVLSIEEKFLPGAGENQTPAPLPAPTLVLVQQTVKRAYELLQCRGYARIDCFYQNASQSPTGHERVVILEVNTLPGLTPATCLFHQAAEAGMKPFDLLDYIIELGLEEHQKQQIDKKNVQNPLTP